MIIAAQRRRRVLRARRLGRRAAAADAEGARAMSDALLLLLVPR